MKRRDLIVGSGAVLAGAALKELLWPGEALAQQPPKRGGKFVYTNTYPNSRMGNANNRKRRRPEPVEVAHRRGTIEAELGAAPVEIGLGHL